MTDTPLEDQVTKTCAVAHQTYVRERGVELNGEELFTLASKTAALTIHLKNLCDTKVAKG